MTKRQSTRKKGELSSSSVTTTTNASTPRSSRRTMQQDTSTTQPFDSLHKEMEVIGYGKKNGQYKRKLSRKQITVRTKKRKLLEKEDAEELAILADDNEKIGGNSKSRRLRGSKAAIQDHVIEGSAVFPQQDKLRTKKQPRQQNRRNRTTEKSKSPGENGKGQHKVDASNPENDSDHFDGDLNATTGRGERNDLSNIDDGTEGCHASNNNLDALVRADGNILDNEVGQLSDDDDEDYEPPRKESTKNTSKGSNRKANRTGINNARIAKSRRLFKMRNFQSFRLAQRHGDALGAHARGRRKEAIEKLTEVARDAPSAPQIYSSLGMVYEEWLQETRRSQVVGQAQKTALIRATESGDKAIDDKLEELDPNLTRQLKLAEKAYGSYHVAAILCKKDFTLWVRAADSASEIANIHARAIEICRFSEQLRRHHRSEQKRWLSESQRDYTMADNLKPPGIDVPAKLAAIHMELGNLSEALTILTDLKNRGSSRAANAKGDTVPVDRSEFESSYKAWWLYADLMLRIGHECTQWNRGVRTNENYMFRRWLRKHSREFDWQERRLQSLSLALEAATGSNSAGRFLVWIRQRARTNTTSSFELNGGKERWHLDTDGSAALDDPDQHINDRNEKVDGDTLNDHEKAVDDTRNSAKNNVDVATPGALQEQETKLAKTDNQEAEQINESATLTASPLNCDPTAGESLHRVTLNGKSGGEQFACDGQETSHFDKEEKLLIAKNAEELQAFDRTTEELGLEPGSVVQKDRDAARERLVFRQKDEIRMLAREYGQAQNPSKAVKPNSNIEHEDEVVGLDQTPLPISGSCRTVCRIALELMKHMYGLGLFEGGTFVGETVSLYLKERAALEDKKIAARKRSDEWQKHAASSLFNFETPYDQIHDEAESSDDDDANIYLSDDEELEGNDALLESLRKGALPPDIRVLFSLSLIVKGDRDFAAKKCVEAIDDLEQESRSWLSDGSVEADVDEDVLWSLFKLAMTGPLGRTSAYAFLADVLQKTAKEVAWSEYLCSFYQQHLQTLREVGLRDELLRMRGPLTPFVNFRKNEIVKSILATARFELHKARLYASDEVPSPVACREDPDECSSIMLTLNTIGSLTDVLHLIWKVESDGAISAVCQETVKVCGRSLAWLTSEGCAKLEGEPLQKIFEYMRRIVSFLCGKTIPDFPDVDKFSDMQAVEWMEFPVQSSWQLAQYKPISLRIYNLCVASNVSVFSGWEPDEFNLRLLRRRYGDRHFGVHIDDGRLAGHLNSSFEHEICRQWDDLKALLESFPNVEYKRRLGEVKEAVWYKNEVQEREKTKDDEPIAQFFEEDGIRVFLAYSSTCLRMATSSQDKHSRNGLIQTALSVLIPISQFSLDFVMWDSEVGEASSTASSFGDWKRLSVARDDPKAQTKPPAQIKSPAVRQRKIPKGIEKKVQDWMAGAEEQGLENFVSISTSEMQEVWNACIAEDISSPTRDDAYTRMQKVHEATQHLRACYTEMAVEKACLQMAVSLLDVASDPFCHNLFVCLQQAAVFASQGSKVGNSDLLFRHPVPNQEACLPLEALLILGRADCLQSVYFPNEAMYLCSYVARVCRIHRDRERTDMEWNSRWKVVAIYAYNVSVMIRATLSSILKQPCVSTWDRDVIEELERARLDAQSWKRSAKSTTSTEQPSTNDVQHGGKNSTLDSIKDVGHDGGADGAMDDDDADTCDEGDSEAQDNETAQSNPKMSVGVTETDATNSNFNESGATGESKRAAPLATAEAQDTVAVGSLGNIPVIGV